MIQGLHHVRERMLSSGIHDGIASGPGVGIAASRGASDPTRHTVAIIGAGFGGMGMAIRLKRAGWHDFIIFEQADTVGGVWRDNRVPELCLRHPGASLFAIVCAKRQLATTVPDPDGDPQIF